MNCIMKMNRQMKNVPAKSSRYDFRMKMSIFLIGFTFIRIYGCEVTAFLR